MNPSSFSGSHSFFISARKNDITEPSWGGGGDAEDDGVVQGFALNNIVDLGDGGDAGEGDGSESGEDGFEVRGETDSDFPVMSESWSSQVVWSEEDGEGDEQQDLVSDQDQ